jgi:hypothetical protein
MEIAQFLELAVPALADYQRRRDDPQATAVEPEVPETLAENQFWNDFLDERDEILRLKWIESQKAGRDIGYERAIQLWLKHRPEWRLAHTAPTPPLG